MPDPAAENKNIRLYTDALRDEPQKRGLTFADMNDFLGDGPKAAPLTDDEMHLTGAGYWRSAFALEQAWACRNRPADATPLGQGRSGLRFVAGVIRACGCRAAWRRPRVARPDPARPVLTVKGLRPAATTP